MRSSSPNGMTPRPLKAIAKLIGGKLIGKGDILITGICGIKEAKPGDLTFIANSKYLSLLESTKASAVITSTDVRIAPKPVIQTENPSLAFAKLAAMLLGPEGERHPQGVSPKAVMGKGVRLGKGVAVQPFVVIEDDVVIGDRTVIYAHSYVGRRSRIGNDCLIYPNVSIREKVEIGHRVVIHSGSVIGSDGFGFATVKGIHHKIPQVGTVVIEDDVEIGANVTIDRARFEKTVIGKGTKIDNLVQIAHNVVTGSNCILVAQSGISGSTTLGNNVVLAGQSGVVGHISIGDNVMVGAQAGVSKSVPANTPVWGSPAKPLRKAKRLNAALQRLPELTRTVESMRKRLEQREAKR
ncbi:MAG: UDP-3-O-(3-hydroxymyristoyl)glucosamine N-acyltransferase [Candidatus Omnitrophica bacterium]|nr:UDP-3-O-(3-hydroxymyristoyl)glucosamine N-acyltransferase [Candidatus Omnitrophota bacterium]